MLAGAFPSLRSVPVVAKLEVLLSPDCFPSSLHRRCFNGLPSRCSVFRCKFRHLTPARPACMAALSSPIAFPSEFKELRDDGDFESILTPEGHLLICGFGSLLSERSARSTFPNLKNFRVAFLRRFRRVFAHVAPVFYERGIAKEETKEVSSLSVEPCEGETLIVTVFEITRSEISSFIERENEFRFLAVILEDLDGGLRPL